MKQQWMDGLKGFGGWFTETFTVWRLLTVSCIVFAAGISGTWFNDQFSDNLQVSRWGWFGATIAGVAIFSGVMLAVDSLEPIYVKREKDDTDETYQGKLDRAVLIKQIGFWAGVGAVIVGVLADCVMSAAYFGAGHDIITAGVLGFYPSVLSVIGGVIEGVRGIGKRNEKRQTKEHDADRDITLKIELAKIDARKEIALNKQLLLTSGQIGGQVSDNSDSQESDKKARFQAWYTTRPNKLTLTGSDVEKAFGVSARTGQRWLSDIRQEIDAKNG